MQGDALDAMATHAVMQGGGVAVERDRHASRATVDASAGNAAIDPQPVDAGQPIFFADKVIPGLSCQRKMDVGPFVAQAQWRVARAVETPAIVHRPRGTFARNAGGIAQVQRGGGERAQDGGLAFVLFGRADELVEMAIQIAGIDRAFDHRRMPRKPFEEGDVRFRPFDLAGRERFAQAGEGGFAVSAVNDQLGDHRVVEDRHRVAFHHAGIDAHVRHEFRQPQAHQLAGAGQEAGIRVFGVQANFDRVAAAPDRVLATRQRLACRHA